MVSMVSVIIPPDMFSPDVYIGYGRLPAQSLQLLLNFSPIWHFVQLYDAQIIYEWGEQLLSTVAKWAIRF